MVLETGAELEATVVGTSGVTKVAAKLWAPFDAGGEWIGEGKVSTGEADIKSGINASPGSSSLGKMRASTVAASSSTSSR